jgi:hypothetical protein
MLRPRNLYLFGTALLTTAAVIEGGTTAALVTSGVAIMIYAFFMAMASLTASLSE